MVSLPDYIGVKYNSLHTELFKFEQGCCKIYMDNTNAAILQQIGCGHSTKLLRDFVQCSKDFQTSSNCEKMISCKKMTIYCNVSF